MTFMYHTCRLVRIGSLGRDLDISTVFFFFATTALSSILCHLFTWGVIFCVSGLLDSVSFLCFALGA